MKLIELNIKNIAYRETLKQKYEEKLYTQLIIKLIIINSN